MSSQAREAEHLSADVLEAGLDEIRRSPVGEGTVVLIVRRPAQGAREVLEEGTLDSEGLVGDRWRTHRSSRTADGAPNRDTQLTLMNSRVIALVAQAPERWALAGDQLYVDLDLSTGHMPPGTRLALGSAVIEVTAEPHTGCKKFSRRFGVEAVKFLSTPTGKSLQLRGINTRVVEPGTVRRGDAIRTLR